MMMSKTDSGATSHMSDNPCIFSSLPIYKGSDSIMKGVGKLLPISHVRRVHLTTTSRSMTLKNVLYVPTMQKNLLSITQFTDEHNCCMEFASNGFTIIMLDQVK